MSLEFAQTVKRIPVYPAAAGYSMPESVAHMASNESPEPPLPEVRAAIEHALVGLNRYPDPTNAGLRSALSDRFGVPAARIAIGSGSCDILLAAGEALLEPGAELVYAWPSFSIYPHLETASGATAIRVGLNDRDEHDLDAMLAEITVATRLVIVCNPNNPTSTALPFSEIERFVKAVPPNVCVILDEAYCEYSVLDDPDATLDLLPRHPNLVLLRTFSKVYGLCGLRVGYALSGSEEFVAAVDQMRQPFFCNALAQAAAIEALKHQDAVTRRVERAVAERLEMMEALTAMNVAVAESQANFVWAALPIPDKADAAEFEDMLVRSLAARGVLVRAGTALGRPGAMRVTLGTPQENRRFRDELADLLGS
ncbi:MAG TPA: aminotransferase class I/II-fold pyridoxal phosphate-dependent enzyme [Baekduia sp.]|nr:aminotransferase class I/II-fold pyridoxal phosphate-dependent enzyme [Baekduia sp.]